MSETINLDTKNIAKEVKVTIKLYRSREFRLRLWLAEKFIRWGMALSWFDFDVIEQHPLEQVIERLGEQGIVISIAYGVMQGRDWGKGLSWSVTCLNDKTREEFDRPFVGNSFAHCVEIAHIEAEKRGWLDE